MSKLEKEKQATPALAGGAREIVRLRKMRKEFEKGKDVRSVLRVKGRIALQRYTAIRHYPML